VNREDNICARQWLAGHPLAGTASPSNWLRYRVTPHPRWFSRQGGAAPPLRGQRVRDAGALPSLGLARGGRAHRGSSREKTEPAQPLVVPLAPRGPVCRRGILSGLHDEGRAAVRVAMGLQSGPLGHARGGRAQRAQSCLNRPKERATPARGPWHTWELHPRCSVPACVSRRPLPTAGPHLWPCGAPCHGPHGGWGGAGRGMGAPCGLDRGSLDSRPESDFSLENRSTEGQGP
jgi:hypothetical protein